ncbi:hypothetical protein RCL1_003248 [Eukaryota sp. TZLM3-RCL]
MPVVFTVEAAKSSRSECRACKNKIDKGIVRVGKIAFRKVPGRDEPVETCLWHHLECIDSCPADAVQNPSEYFRGFDDLDASQKESLIAHMDAVKKEVTSAPRGSKPEAREDMPPHKEASEAMISHLSKRTVDKLKSELKANEQTSSGKKDELVQKVAEGRTNGTIPGCPVCGGGKLKFLANKNVYYCPGYMDAENFVSCGENFEWNQIQRKDWEWPADDTPEAVEQEAKRLEAQRSEVEEALDSDGVPSSEQEDEFQVEAEESSAGKKRRAASKPVRQSVRKGTRSAPKRKSARRAKDSDEEDED